MKRRGIAILLSVGIVFSGMPGNVFAAEEIDISAEDMEDEGVDIEEIQDSALEENSEIENIEFTDANRAEDFTDDITDSEIAVEDSLSSADAVASGKVIKKGKCGDNLTCTIVENASNRYTLIIDGNGNMYDYLTDYNTSQRPWHQYRQKINTVIMKEGVSSIGNSAFSNLSNLKNIKIEGSLINIGMCAFEYCRSLKSIDLSNMAYDYYIGSYTFYGCSSLTSITLSDKMTGISNNAFEDCRSLKSITIPEGVKSIGECAFSGCSSLTGITIPNSVTELEYGVFEKCSSLKTIKLSNNITKIEGATFSGCRKLTNITIPKGVTSIGRNAFLDCQNLKSATIPDSVTKIDDNVFYACSSLKNIKIPNSVKSIGEDVFDGCSSLTNITIPEGIKEIKYFTFAGCSGLKSVKIPNSVKRIGEYAFGDCSGLSSITIPGSVTEIDDQAFQDCKRLKSIEIPKGVKRVGGGAFSRCESLENVKISNSVTELGNSTMGGTFEGCSSLRSIIIPKNVTKIGHGIFYGSGLKTINYTGSESQWKKLKLTPSRDLNNAKVKYNYVPDHTHKYKTSSTKAATCEKIGKKIEKCTICGKTRVQKIPATGHKSVKDKAVAATCEKNGKTEGNHCSVCKKVLKVQQVIKAKGHKWSKWNVIQAATVTSKGKQQRACANCGKKESKEIPKLAPSGIPQKLTIELGKTSVLKPNASWKNVKYSTSAAKVVTVDKNGKIKAIGVGTAKITVQSESKKAICIVTVPGTTAIQGIPSSVTIKKGKDYILKPKLSYVGKSDVVAYTSSDNRIATVSSGGKVTGKKKGKVTIKVKSGKVTKNCKITVE